MSGDPRLRFRVWIAARLIDEVWLDTTSPDVQAHMASVRSHHLELVAVAERRGDPWLCEVYDPARPQGEAHVRFGTDPAGMVEPRPWQGQPIGWRP